MNRNRIRLRSHNLEDASILKMLRIERLKIIARKLRELSMGSNKCDFSKMILKSRVGLLLAFLENFIFFQS